MWGANTGELRNQSDVFHMKRDEVSDAFRRSSSAVKECVWEGPDADRFKDEYDASLGAMIDQLCDLLQDRHTDMQRQAQEQDDCSDLGGGGGGGQSLWDRFKQWLGEAKDGLIDLYKAWSKAKKFAGFPRFLMEAAALLKNPMLLDLIKNNPFSWGPFTGRNLDDVLKKLKIKSVEGLASKLFGPGYNKIKELTDFINMKGISEALEKKLPGDWGDHLANFFGKEGRALGRGLGAVGVLMDAAEAFNAGGDIWGRQAGDLTKGSAWNAAQAALGAASFIPGPVGWTCAGVSAGMAIYENREAIGNALSHPVQTAQNIANGAKDIASALNPFD